MPLPTLSLARMLQPSTIESATACAFVAGGSCFSLVLRFTTARCHPSTSSSSSGCCGWALNDFPSTAARLSALKTRCSSNDPPAKLSLPLTFLLDPDLKFTKAYSLRWDAPNETSHPTTIVVDKDGKIAFLKISERHGGRSRAKEILAELL